MSTTLKHISTKNTKHIQNKKKHKSTKIEQICTKRVQKQKCTKQPNIYKHWKNKIYGFDGFDKAIDALDVKSYELKVPRVVGQINSQGFFKSFNDMLKTASFILSKVEQKYNPDSYKMITPKELLIKLQTNVVLPLAVIIDWQLDNKSKLHYVEQTMSIKLWCQQ